MGEDRSAWTPEDICKALWARGYSLRKLAAELGTTPNTLRRNIDTGRSAKIRAELSIRLHVPEWRLWPEIFPPQWRDEGPPQG
jgi:lambda repressor-like predicted transcriptional regulator